MFHSRLASVTQSAKNQQSKCHRIHGRNGTIEAQLKVGDLSFATLLVRSVPNRHGAPWLLNRSGLRFNHGLVSVDRSYAAIARAAGETRHGREKGRFSG